MATFLDVSGLGFFSSVFTFVLIFVTTYALLSWGSILGKSNGLHALIALSISVLFMFSKDAISLVNYVVPWFVIMFILILLMLMGYSLFNPGGNIFELLVSGDRHKTIIYWIITLSVVIILLGLGNTYGQKVGPYLNEGETGSSSTGSTYYGNDTNSISGISNNIRGDGYVNSGDYTTNLGATIFHPKILGIIFILLLGTFTILFMAGK